MIPFFAAPAALTSAPSIVAPVEQNEVSVPLPEESGSGASLKFALGGYYGRFFAIPTYGGEFTFEVGGRLDRTYLYAGGHLELGRTAEGLSTWAIHPNALVEWVAGPVRYGAEARFGAMAIKRVTENDWLAGLSVGGGLHVSVNLLQSSRGALYLQATGAADDYFDPVALSATLSLGYRWDPGPRR